MKVVSILLCLLMLSVLSLSATAAQEVKEVKKTVTLNPDGRVSIDTFKGSVTVTAWDRPQVDIQARVEADEESDDQAQTVQNTEVDIEASESSVWIKSDYEKLQDWHSAFDDDNIRFPYVHYTISMPRTAQLTIKDFKSTLKVTGLRSHLKINSFKGPITISGFEGSLDLDTFKSEVRVEFVTLFQRNRIETFKGTVDLVLPKGKGFDLDADIGHGDLDADFEFSVKRLSRGRSRSYRDIEYRGAVNGGGPTLSLRTHKGNYRLRQR
ncbi:MAG: DUF4097 family beta strand repeat protein [Candidatus Latescibacteria bacterium]|nr:DUF4097 family beta strand repeat protein [Candidatus Latescibacterota bacterium]